MSHTITVTLEIDNADNIKEAAEFAAQQLMNEEVHFEIEDNTTGETGSFNTADFAQMVDIERSQCILAT